MKTSLLKKLSAAVGVATMLIAANTVSAVPFVINLGGAPLTGTGPSIASNSIVLSFDQSGLNTVRLTITAGPDAIKVDDIFFNVDRAVSFAFVSGVNPANGFSYSLDGFGPNGGTPSLTGFDVKVDYGVSGANGQFFNGQTTVVDISATGLVPASFNVLAANGYLGSTHINKPLGGNDSGKYANAVPGGGSRVPDGGGTLALFGLALAFVGLWSRRGNPLR
ncbi:MAG TPA: hypothetical protein PKX00_16615 [Opitutaceae bacterium]|nr:hypothetical protein [Opitutaceae bacterium]